MARIIREIAEQTNLLSLNAAIEAARESSLIMRRLRREREEVALKHGVTEGAVLVKDVDKASFQKAMRSVYQQFLSSPQQKALFQAISSLPS